MFSFNSEHWYRVFNQSPVGIAIIGLDGEWLKVNDALCRILEYSEPELIGRKFQDFTHPEDIGPDLDLVNKIVLGDIDAYTMLKRYITKTGKVIWVNLTVGSIEDENGILLHFVSHILPISSYEKIEVVNGQINSRPVVSVRDFIMDNWQWFFGVVAATCTVIVTLSILLYKSDARLDIIEKRLEQTEQVVK